METIEEDIEDSPGSWMIEEARNMRIDEKSHEQNMQVMMAEEAMIETSKITIRTKFDIIFKKSQKTPNVPES